MVMMANTVVDPRAMVIHFHHAPIDKKREREVNQTTTE